MLRNTALPFSSYRSRPVRWDFNPGGYTLLVCVFPAFSSGVLFVMLSLLCFEARATMGRIVEMPALGPACEKSEKISRALQYP